MANDLENYLKTKERAEGLMRRSSRFDQLVDEIVYELYRLSEEGIEIAEEAVEK